MVWLHRVLALGAVFAFFLSFSANGGEAETGFIETPDGVSLYYEKTGSGEPTLVIPGRLFVADWLAPLAEDHTVIFYDMRNRGRSDSIGDESLITLLKDVADVEAIRRHFGLDEFYLVGTSYLGLMVAVYGTEHPERVKGLVQLAAVPRVFGTEYAPQYLAHDDAPLFSDEERAHLQALRAENVHEEQPAEYCLEEWAITQRMLVGSREDLDVLAGHKEDICAMENEWPVNFVRHLNVHFKSVQEFELDRAAIGNFGKPVLVIHGTQDRNAPYGGAREWAYMWPDARLLTVEGAAHYVFAERQDKVVDAIRAFAQGE